MPNIVVVGAGVSGLTTALLLARRKGTSVTIAAKHMPGDYDIEYTSPWAGADVMPMADAANSRWERDTWPEIKRLAAEVPEAGIHFQKAHIYRPVADPKADTGPFSGTFDDENPWWAALFPDFHAIAADDLPPGVASGSEWTSVCINPPLYLAWLVGQCRAAGVVLRRARLQHISEAAALHDGPAAAADLVVNCTGLLASRLGGVADASVVPARGQTVLVRNALEPMIAFDDGRVEGEVCYAMCRASGGGTVLGGTFQLGNWDAAPDPRVAERIMARVVAVHPQLRGQGVEVLDVVRHQVGLRPYRKGGVRVEREKIEGRWVVHNYGHGGWGYQGSYGCAERVVELVEEIVAEMDAVAEKSG